MEKCIKEMAYMLGVDVCEIGNIDRFKNVPERFSPIDLFENCKSVISIGIALPKELYEVSPRLLYGHFSYQICSVLDTFTLKLLKEIENKYNCNAIPVPCDAPNEYWEADSMTAKGLISMKHTAVMCGLGSIGKSSLFLNKEYGNRLIIGAILTDLELSSDSIQPNLCISGCYKCIDNCPSKAINKDGTVTQKLCRMNAYGKTARGFDTVDCNKCRIVCPMRFGKAD